MAYLSVDHVGFGGAEGRIRKERVWLRFKNNCRLPISLHANGAPTDAPDDDMTVMYELIRPMMRRVVITAGRSHPEAKRVTPPPDTMSEVGSSVMVLPGESALFSVPRTHCSKDWEMHIPFQFRLPPGKGPWHDNAWGAESEMFLAYTFWYLPPSVQRASSASKKYSLSSCWLGYRPPPAKEWTAERTRLKRPSQEEQADRASSIAPNNNQLGYYWVRRSVPLTVSFRSLKR